MSFIPEIQTIEPSLVIHKLIVKPLGTYIIRASTSNDDILSRIKFNPKTNSLPYIVLSVRTDERKTQSRSPIMNYRLPLIKLNGEGDLTHLLDRHEQIGDNLSILIKQCIVNVDDTDWEIEKENFQNQSTLNYPFSGNSDMNGNRKCILQTKNNCLINVFKKLFQDNEQGFQHEFSILKNLSYFHIVSFYGICTITDQFKYLVFADHGDTLKSRCPIIKYSDELFIKILSMIGFQIACGMMYLEYKHIIHRDLYAKNILIDKYNNIRIADFGHAIIIDDRYQESIKNSKLNFQTRRLAPECLPLPPENEEGIELKQETLLVNFSSKSDVWACGLIFIELMMDKKAEVYPKLEVKKDDNEETLQLSQYIKQDGNIHEKPDDCPEMFYNVLKQCWAYHPESRISFVHLRNEMMELFKSQDSLTDNVRNKCSFIHALFSCYFRTTGKQTNDES